MAEGTFATAINCMDGRVQAPVINYLKKKLGVDYVDMITEPGPIKMLAESIINQQEVDSIKKRVGISVKKHGSGHIAIVGHYDCAGNPVDKETQIKQIHSSAAIVKSWDFGAEIIGLWVDESWRVSEVVM